MKNKKRMAAGVLAAMIALVTVLSVNTEYASAETVKQIRLIRGKEKKVQLDNQGDKETMLYTYTREKISYDKEEETTKYKIIFRLTIDGNTIIEEASTATISDFREGNQRSGSLITRTVNGIMISQRRIHRPFHSARRQGMVR